MSVPMLPPPDWRPALRRRQPPMRAAQGFTLVELMVAMALGLLLLGALIALIVSTVTSRRELDRSARQIENGRYALQVLSEDIELAGFAGTTGLQSWSRQAPVACPTSAADLGYVSGATPRLPLAVQGLTTAPSCLSAQNVKPDTAMLLVTRASTKAVPTASAVSDETYIQVSNFGGDATDFPALQPIVVRTGAHDDFKLRNKHGNPAVLRKAIQRIYFVSSCNECGSDRTPTLKVAEYVKGEMKVSALVEGIDDLQFDYGIDTDNDGAPDCYVSDPANPDADQISDTVCTPPTPAYDWSNVATNWSNVMVVRIHVLARTTEPTARWSDSRTYQLGMDTTVGPFNDPYKRHVYSTVVRLNNPSGLRELP